MSVPIVITSAGAQPQTPASLLAQLLALATAQAPGLTADLPGSLIEDISSTDVGALTLIDAAWVELLNSFSPLTANPFILSQLGPVYGVTPGQASNTSVYVVFTSTANVAGQQIPVGYTVSDGTYQYVVQDGGVTGADFMSLPLFCLANTTGAWAVPSGTVTQLVTQPPTGFPLTVTNPTAGTPAGAAQTEEEYRSTVLQAGQAIGQGMQSYLKTLLGKVPGVQTNLVSVRQIIGIGGGWEIICGGGDPYQVAYAINQSLFDISTLVGSTLGITGITNANPGVITTNLNHNYTSGQVFVATGVVGASALMTAINGVSLTATVLSPTTFSIGINTTSDGAYVSGGVITPNLRNISVNLYDYPDTYTIPFVNPPEQIVTMTLTWNTNATNTVSANSVAQLGQPALVAYVNGLPAGQPMNLFELQNTFQNAVSSIIPPQNLTRMVFSVNINGVGVSPESGTGIIAGDPESFFFAVNAGIVISQG